MREILFRGKNIDLEWIEGDLLQNGVDYRTAIREKKEGLVERVIFHTVGQYTGLTDKNGKKIFEGDIINIEYDETIVKNAVIEYVGASFYGSTDYDSWELDGYCELEVIGNIHDNPELLNN